MRTPVAYLFAFCRLLTGIVFLMSAVSKLRGRTAYEEFTAATRALTRLPARRVRPVAALVVAAEAAVAPLLAWGPTVLAGFCVALGLLAAFTVAIVAALRRGRRVPCRCFGASAVPVGPGHLARNAVLVVAAAAGAVLAATEAVVAGSGAVLADLDPAGLAAVALAAGAMAALLSATGEIADLFTSTP
ncbi:MauE/DoxX family redox-associated membrane protein [Microbispora sp. H10836]|uniref:MauE/DoxX family redox-associated membrane protein n=1 Tax=Microbispora sp. H10836 TaxID=2729106 RepID=UPI0014733740|nr:MauE/DoxX family redox-associated membrane protein [Microbispora sp. H10836]